jgi:hypothetical protein
LRTVSHKKQLPKYRQLSQKRFIRTVDPVFLRFDYDCSDNCLRTDFAHSFGHPVGFDFAGSL